MRKPVPTVQQTGLIPDEKESGIKADTPRLAKDILKVFHRIVNRVGGFIQLTEVEQRDAGVYFGDRRNHL